MSTAQPAHPAGPGRPARSGPDAAARWTHRPATGPVAWGAAVLVVPAMPLLSYFAALLIRLAVDHPMAGRATLDPLGPLPWVLLGLVLLRPGRRRVVRGLGVGIAAGAVTSFLIVAPVSWWWSP